MGFFSGLVKGVKNLVGGITGGDLLGLGGSLLGGKMSSDATSEANSLNYQMQKEFAQNGIRWKVEDAKAAGIHPLYALGASTNMPSPSYVGDTSMGSAVSSAGQDIGRAVSARLTATERNQAKLDALTLERGELENQLLRSQIAKLNQPGNPPPMPTMGSTQSLPGQGNAVNLNPLDRTVSEYGRPAKEVGEIPDYTFVRTDKGYAIVPSMDAKNRIEDQFIPEMSWMMRNLIVPPYPPISPGPGKVWHYRPWMSDFVPRKKYWFDGR